MTAEVRVAEGAADLLLRASAAASPCETGGILIGLKGDGRLWVTQAVEIPPAAPEPARYILPAGLTQPIVARARAEDERLGYLGDWHSHPADSGVSGTDLQTYRRSLRYAARRLETRPLLMVVRKAESGWVLEPSVTSWFGSRTEVAAVILTGPPPRA